MATNGPIQPDATIEATHFIQKVDADPTPANDEGLVPVLESDGRLDGQFLGKKIDSQVFTATGAATWTKPVGASLVRVQIWAAGGSGAATGATPDNYDASGGGGGAYMERWYDADDLSATESVNVGAGGAAKVGPGSGNAGGNSTFGSLITAYGGGAGLYANVGVLGGAGRGQLATDSPDVGDGSDKEVAPANSINGGFGGHVKSDATPLAGASAINGGAGGGAASDSSNTSSVAGTSLRSGDGGAGAYASGNSTAGDGSTPSGGGGAAATDTGTATSGAGGDGKCIVTTF